MPQCSLMQNNSHQKCQINISTANCAEKHSLGCSTISQFVIAHVLKDLLTEVVWVSARVLVGPLNGEYGAFIVVETAHVVATTIVVLGIKEPVSIVSVSPGLIQSVV